MNTQDKFITLPNDLTAVNLCPSLDGKLAVVHLNVITRLAKLLPKVNFEDSKFHFCEALSRTSTLEDFVGMMSDEIAFHKTVNLINTFEFPVDEEDSRYTEYKVPNY